MFFVMSRIFHRRKPHVSGDSICVQGFHKSVKDVIKHFLATGELLIEPSNAVSFDNTDSNIQVKDFDMDSVVHNVSLVEAALLAHNERNVRLDSKHNDSKKDESSDSSPVTE